MVDTSSTVVLGPNILLMLLSNCDYFNIVDLGMNDRVYDPRIMSGRNYAPHNEHLMTMSPEIVDYVIDRVLGKPEPKEDDE